MRGIKVKESDEHTTMCERPCERRRQAKLAFSSCLPILVGKGVCRYNKNSLFVSLTSTRPPPSRHHSWSPCRRFQPVLTHKMIFSGENASLPRRQPHRVRALVSLSPFACGINKCPHLGFLASPVFPLPKESAGSSPAGSSYDAEISMHTPPFSRTKRLLSKRIQNAPAPEIGLTSREAMHLSLPPEPFPLTPSSLSLSSPSNTSTPFPCPR